MSRLSGLVKDERTPAERSADALQRMAAAFERVATAVEKYLDDTEAPAPEEHPAVRRLPTFGGDDPPPPKRA